MVAVRARGQVRGVTERAAESGVRSAVPVALAAGAVTGHTVV